MAYRHNVDLAIIPVPEESAVDTYKQQDANELRDCPCKGEALGKRARPHLKGLYPGSHHLRELGSSTSTEKRGISPLWLETFASNARTCVESNQ